MMIPEYNLELCANYQRLFDTCIITSEKYPVVNGKVDNIIENRQRYETVGSRLNIPWYFIGIVHSVECNNKFSSLLNNRFSSKNETTSVATQKPKIQNPESNWEQCAEATLKEHKVYKWEDWSLPGTLYKLESLNGYGYRKLSDPVNSPYLWSFSNHYKCGKYLIDGKYSPTAISKTCGAAVLLRRLVEKQLIPIDTGNRLALIEKLAGEVRFLPSKYVGRAEELQRLLNLNGAHIMVDGKAGTHTSAALNALTGNYLNGDPRRVL